LQTAKLKFGLTNNNGVAKVLCARGVRNILKLQSTKQETTKFEVKSRWKSLEKAKEEHLL